MSGEQEARQRGSSLISAALLVALSTLTSRALGLIRDRMLAGRFGAGPDLDAYFAAYRIPDLVYNILIIGAISAVFLPLFTSFLVRERGGREEAFEAARSIFSVTLAVTAGFALVLFFAAPYLVPILAPGFDAERADKMLVLTRIMLFQPVLLGISSILGGILTSFNKFMAYALAPVSYNVGIIFGIVFFAPRFGIEGVAWGAVLGALLHLCVQLPHALALGFRPGIRITIGAETVKKFGKMIVPRLISLMASQIGLVVVTVLGSTFAAGSIAAFTFADNLQAVPIGIVGISFAIAAFPQLSLAASRNSLGNFVSTLTRSVRVVLFLVMPLSVAMLLLRAQIVRIVLGTGSFNWEDTVMTLDVLGVLVVSVFAQSLVPLLARGFFAMHDTKTPMISSVIAIAANIALALLLGPRMGVMGLALAFSAGAIVNFVILLGALHNKLGGLRDGETLMAVFKISVASMAAGVAIQLTKSPVAALVDMQKFSGIFTQFAACAIAGAAVYLVVGKVLRVEEIRHVAEGFKGGFRKREETV